jgi:hypothetical protein
MKKVYFIIFCSVLSSFYSSSQTTVTIGTGTSNGCSAPWNRYFNYSASEQIYTGTEIGTTGNITSIAFSKSSGTSGLSICCVTIYMKTTAATTVSSPASTAGYTQVYSGVMTNSGTSGWQSVALNTPFVFSSTSQNLSILIVKGYESYSSSRPYYNYTTQATNKSSYYNDDSYAWSSGSTTMTPNTSRPNIQLVLAPTPTIPTVPSATTSASSICSGSSLTLTASGLAPGVNVANFAASNTSNCSSQITSVSNTFTIEFWANPTTTRTSTTESSSGTVGTSSQRYAIFPSNNGGSTSAGAGISVGTNGVSVFEHCASYLPSTLVYNATLSGWTHIAVVYNNRTPSLYINGILVRTGVISAKATVYPSIGTGNTYGYYEGQLDNIRIWSTARSQSEIFNNMSLQTPSSTTGLISFHTFNGSNYNAETGYGTNLTPAGSGLTYTTPSFYTYTWTGSGAPSASTSETQTANPVTSGTFSVIASQSGFNSSTAQTTSSVSVNSVTSPGSITVNNSPQCAGTGITFTKGSCSSGTCYWVSSASGTETTNSSATYTTSTTANTYNVWVRAYDGSCWSSSVTASGVVNATPSITVQPTNQTATTSSSATFSITATGANLTYQWQEYISTWNNINNGGVYSGATTSSLLITNPAFSMNGNKYRCVVSGCSPSATSDGNATLTVSYCTPVTTNINAVDIITNMVLTNSLSATLTQASTSNGSTNYDIYNNSPLNLILGTTTNKLAITFGTDATQYSAAWIDFNRNGVYEASENIALASSSSSSGATVNYTFTVPAGASTGITRMRVRGGADGAYTTSNACSTIAYGETEDYLVNIIDACITPTTVVASTSSSTVCSGSSATFQFSSQTGGTCGSSYNWEYQWENNAGSVIRAWSSTSSYSETISGSTTYKLRMRCSGCTSSTTLSSGVTVTTYTTSAVTPTLSSPANESTVSSSPSTLSWSGTLSSNPSSRYDVKVNSGAWTSNGTSTTYSASLSVGLNTWAVRYYDACTGTYYTSSTFNLYYAPNSYCGTVDHGGNNWTISSSTTVSGNHTNVGVFTINSGIIATVDATCHYFNVDATSVSIAGTINGNGAGGSGGTGGAAGSSYGSCSNSSDVYYSGGGSSAGGNATGTGAGQAGTNGGNAYGYSRKCGGLFCSGNKDGEFGGGGGSGGGSGGGYGGAGGAGSYGAYGGYFGGGRDGRGTFGSGNSGGSTHGNSTDQSITWGAGGGGAGGGGGSIYSGTAGGSGGAGGGAVKIVSSGALTVSGTISCNGTNGGNGGNGSTNSSGDWDCSGISYCDYCGVCSEATYFTEGGAGGGAGGGSGGGIIIQGCGTVNVTGTLTATGGTGGAAGSPRLSDASCNDYARGGGGGGGGRIKIFRNPCESNTITPTTSTSAGSGGAGDATGNAGESGTVEISINHPSYNALAAGTIGSNQTICTGGDPGAFTSLTTPTGGNCQQSYTYQWMKCTSGCGSAPTNYTNCSSATEITFNESTLTTSTYYVRKVTSGNCSSYSNSVLVTVVADPSAPTATKSPNVSTVCAGQILTLINPIDNGGGTGTCTIYYRYSTTIAGLSTASWSSTIPSTTATTGSFYIEMMKTCDGNGCNDSPVTQYSWTIVDDPLASISSGNSICKDDPFTFTSSLSNGTGTPTYQWYSSSDNVNFSAIGAANSDSYSPPTNIVGTTYYRLNVSYSGYGCNEAVSNIESLTIKSFSTAPSSVTVDHNNTCNGTSKTLTINGGSLGTSAEWQWFTGSCGGTPAGTGNSITVDPAAGSSTTYYVRASGVCNTTVCINETVVVNPAAPVQPEAIAGTATQCPGLTNQTYSISDVLNATSYSWTVPSGWSITSGNGTSSINVTTGASGNSGDISVEAVNSCGTSSPRTLAVSVSPDKPNQPGAISGTLIQCPELTNQTYSISGVANATSYSWTVPSGWTITDGNGTNSIKVTTGTIGDNGDISVTASNSCGTSSAKTLAVIISTPSTPPTGFDVINDNTCAETSKTLTVTGGSLGDEAEWQWFTGSCGGSLVNTGSSIVVNPSATTTYYVKGMSTCFSTTCYSEDVSVTSAPSNDLCVDATTIATLPYSSGLKTTNCATDDIPAIGGSSCGSHSRNVWYKFTGNGAQVEINTCNALTNFNTELHIYTGICGSMTEVKCNDDGLSCSDGKSSLLFCTNLGTQYFISLGNIEAGSTDVGNYVLSVLEKTIAPATISSNYICGNGTVTLDANAGLNSDIVEFSTDGGSTVAATDISAPYQFTTSSFVAPQTQTVSVRSKNSTSLCVGSWTNSATANAYELPVAMVNSQCHNGLSRKVEIIGSGGSLSYDTYEQESPFVSHASNIFAVPFGQTKNFRVKDSRNCVSEWIPYTAPQSPSTISDAETHGSCIVRGTNNWWHVTNSDNQVVLSINDNNNDLGAINAWVFVEPVTTNYSWTYYLKRHFKITSQNSPSAPVLVRFYFTDAELTDLITNSKLNSNSADDVNSIEDLKITRYSGVNEDDNFANNDMNCNSCFNVYNPSWGVSLDPDLGSDIKYLEILVPGFSEDWIHGAVDTLQALSVDLLTFNSKCLDKNALIQWITASETNNNYFTVERSENGVDYLQIAQIQGSGNSNGLNEYSYLDTKPDGTVYYRLKQVDFDGTTHIFNPISLNCKNNNTDIRIIPNPFKDKISIIGLVPDLTQLDVFNSEGAKVYNQIVYHSNASNINLGFLMPGIYMLRLTEPNGTIHKFKLVRN